MPGDHAASEQAWTGWHEQVRTELVLQCLRAGDLEAVLQTDTPRQQLEEYFQSGSLDHQAM